MFWKITNLSKNYLDFLASHGLVSFIKEITRPRSGNCLDHIYGRLDSFVSSCEKGVCDFKISDHSMTAILIDIGKKYVYLDSTFGNCVTKIDFRKLKTNLSFEFWEEFFSEGDPSKSYDIFIDTLRS